MIAKRNCSNGWGKGRLNTCYATREIRENDFCCFHFRFVYQTKVWQKNPLTLNPLSNVRVMLVQQTWLKFLKWNLKQMAQKTSSNKSSNKGLSTPLSLPGNHYNIIVPRGRFRLRPARCIVWSREQLLFLERWLETRLSITCGFHGYQAEKRRQS